jgi:hypothetical protein
MKTLTKPKPVREELLKLSGAIRFELERGKARAWDTASDCEHMVLAPRSDDWGTCDATPLNALAHAGDDCPQTCRCFRRRP